MFIAASVKRFFSQYKIRYEVLSHEPTVTLNQAQHALEIPASTFARCVLLGDKDGLVLAILPLNHKLDFNLINKYLKRQLSLVTGGKVDKVFHDCEPGSHPIIGEPYGLKMVVDPILKKAPYIHFEPGTHTSVVRLTQADFRFIYTGATWAPLSVPIETKDNPSSAWHPSKKLQEKLNNLYKPCLEVVCKNMADSYPLPPLPPLAHEILDLTSQTKPCLKQLKDLLQQDPNMTQCLLNYTNEISQKPCQSIEQSIQCFGVERLGHLAMAASAGRVFQVQRMGPLGLEAFWRHAFHGAQMCRLLAMDAKIPDVKPSTAFLCGLMHNFGFLLFGHLFGPEFKLLNKMYAMNPKMPIQLLEKKILGLGKASHVMKLGHACMGAWLLESWGLQTEVVTVARHHHHAHYHGPYKNYVQLMYVVNSLLKDFSLGDGQRRSFDQLPLEELGLTSTQIEKCLENEAFAIPSSHCLSVGIAR